MEHPRAHCLALLAALALAPACGNKGGASAPAAPAAAAAATAVPGALAPTSDAGPSLPLDPSIVTGKLANGLTYFVRRNGKPARRAELWLAVDAGSVLEDDDQLGLAHFVEHMAFNGTRKYAKQAIVDWLEKTGMKFGPDVNAFTSFDETVYQIQVPSDDPALFEHGLDILHEWAGSVAFDPEEVDKERGVVLEERRLHRGAEGRLTDKVVPAALPGSVYGARIPIGTEASLKAATPARLRRFYADWYRPDLMAIIVVGDVDPAATEKLIRERFADLAAPASPRPRPAVAVPPHKEPITLTVQDPELPVTVVAVVSKQPRQVVRSEGDYRAALTEDLFTAMLNQRLTELGRSPEAPFAGASVGKLPIVRAIDVWYQAAMVKGERAPETLTAVATELGRVARFGFTDGEIARARQDVLHRYEVGAREKDKTESRALVEELSRVFLTGEGAPGAEAELALAKRLVPAITAGEIQAVAARAASEQNRVILAAGHTSVKLPAERALLTAVAAGAARATAAYVDDAASGPLVAAPPKPGTIERERAIAELGVTEWTLSNGARVVLKPTDFKNDQVSIAAFSLGGSSLASEADFVAAESADDVVEAGGAGELSATRLAKALSGTGVDLGVEVGRYEQSISGGGQPEHLERLFQLAYLRLTAPRRDPAAIEAWRAQEVEARARQLDDPGTVFSARVREAVTGKHPRTRLLTSEDFARLDADRALAFYRARLGHGRGLTLVIVGSFALEAIKPLVLTYVGGLPPGKAERWRDIGIKRPRGEVKVEVVQGVEPKAQVELVFHRKAAWSRADELDLEALADALSIRLREELREGLGGTYGVSVHGQLVREPRGEAIVDIEFGCGPDSVAPLLARARELIADFQKAGPPAAVVDKVKQAARRQRETALKENGFWLAELYRLYRYGDDPRRAFAEHDELIERLSPARIQAAARRYLGRDVVVGVLKPAAQPAAAPAAQPPPASPARVP